MGKIGYTGMQNVFSFSNTNGCTEFFGIGFGEFLHYFFDLIVGQCCRCILKDKTDGIGFFIRSDFLAFVNVEKIYFLQKIFFRLPSQFLHFLVSHFFINHQSQIAADTWEFRNFGKAYFLRGGEE